MPSPGSSGRPITSLTSPLRRANMLASDFVEKDDPAYYRRRLRPLLQGHARRPRPGGRRRISSPRRSSSPSSPPSPTSPRARPSRSVPCPTPPRPRPQPNRPGPRRTPSGPTLPGPSDSPTWHAPRHVRKTLSNGLDLWVVPWKTLPIVEARLLIPVGTADDPAGQGRPRQPDGHLARQGDEDQDRHRAGRGAGGAGHLALGRGLRQPTRPSVSRSSRGTSRRPSRCSAQILTAPRFDPKDFDRERKLELDGLLQGPDSPPWIAQRAFRALLFGQDHPYGKPGSGYVRHGQGDHARRRPVVPRQVSPRTARPSSSSATSTPRRSSRPSSRPSGPGRRPDPNRPPGRASEAKSVPGGGLPGRQAGGRPERHRRRPALGRDRRTRATSPRSSAIMSSAMTSSAGSTPTSARRTVTATAAARTSATGGREAPGRSSTSVRADVTAEALKEILGELDDLAGESPA